MSPTYSAKQCSNGLSLLLTAQLGFMTVYFYDSLFDLRADGSRVLGSQSGRILSLGSIIYSSRGFIGEIKLCRHCTHEKLVGLNVSFPRSLRLKNSPASPSPPLFHHTTNRAIKTFRYDSG